MKHNKIFIVPVLAICSCSLQAAPVDRAQAAQTARAFLRSQGRSALSLAPVEIPQRMRARWQAASAASEPFYIFNAPDDGGFVIVAGDDAFAGVIGYADQGHFSLDEAPSNLQQWMGLYARYVQAAATDSTATASVAPVAADPTVIVQPLLDPISWGQAAPFYNQCPTYTSGGVATHYYTGCVATAATQIMRYYGYPAQGQGQKSITSHGQTLTADFGHTTYRWDLMPAIYPDGGGTVEQDAAAATLAAHFGIAVEMSYEEAGSGAYDMLVPQALKTYFGYDSGATFVQRNYYSTSEWMALIRQELDEGRPVFYGATSDYSSAGHAFVCDGYDSNDFVHINWGWYGRSNGYFLVNRLNPSSLGIGGGTGGYNRDQDIVIGIQPPVVGRAERRWPLYAGARLGLTADNPRSLTLMTIVENFDTDDFDGQLAAVLTQGSRVVQVLGEGQSVQLKGFASGHSGSQMVTVRGIDSQVDGLADGAYELRLAFRPAGYNDWQILRHYTGFAGYADVSVSEGRVTVEGLHQVVPRVALTAPVTPSGELYAGGYGKFHISLRNNSTDVRLKELVLRFTSAEDQGKSYELKQSVNVYEESDADLTVLGDLPADLPAGDYDLTVSEASWPDALFDDAAVGRTRVQVLPAVNAPVMRMEQAPEWKNANGQTTLKQGDNLSVAVAVRNYGAAGTAQLLTFMQPVDQPDKRYLFQQANVTAERGELVAVPFYRKTVVDPGTYRLITCVAQADGSWVPVASAYADPMIEVSDNPDVVLNAVHFDLPDTLTVGQRSEGSITLSAPRDFTGTFYLRLRQFTITTGEIVEMKNITLKAGEERTLSFTYRPSVDPGRYVVLVEAKSGGNEGTIGQYANCYKTVVVRDATTDVPSIEAQATAVGLHQTGNRLQVTGPVERVEFMSPDGRLVRTVRPDRGSVSVDGLPRGIYVVRLVTQSGATTYKLAL